MVVESGCFLRLGQLGDICRDDGQFSWMAKLSPVEGQREDPCAAPQKVQGRGWFLTSMTFDKWE